MDVFVTNIKIVGYYIINLREKKYNLLKKAQNYPKNIIKNRKISDKTPLLS